MASPTVAAGLGSTFHNRHSAPTPHLDTTTHLQLVFQYYCRFGRTGGHWHDTADTMDSFQWAKLTRECPGLLDDVLTPTDVDIIFIKVKSKSARRITFSQFLDALSALATVKYYGLVDDAATAFSLLLTNQVFQTPPAHGVVSAFQSGLLQLTHGQGGGPSLATQNATARLSSTAAAAAYGSAATTPGAASVAAAPVTMTTTTPAARPSGGSGVPSTSPRMRSPQQRGGGAAAGMTMTTQLAGSPKAGSVRAPGGEGSSSPRSPAAIAATLLRDKGLLQAEYLQTQAAASDAALAATLQRSSSAFAPTQAAGEAPDGGSAAQDRSLDPVMSHVTPPTDVYELVLRKAYEATLLQQQQQSSSSYQQQLGGGGVNHTPADGAAAMNDSAVLNATMRSSSTTGGGGAGGSARGRTLHRGAMSVGGGGGGAYSSITGSAIEAGRGYTTQLHPPVALAPSFARAAAVSGSPRHGSPRAVDRNAGMGRYGEPDFKPTIAGSANRPGSVYERLADPASFTGVYRRAWETDGRINHYTETGLSTLPSKFRGSTNTGSDETIRDIRVLLRPNLAVGRFFK